MEDERIVAAPLPGVPPKVRGLAHVLRAHDWHDLRIEPLPDHRWMVVASRGPEDPLVEETVVLYHTGRAFRGGTYGQGYAFRPIRTLRELAHLGD